MLEDTEEVEDSLYILIYEGLMVEAWSLAGLLQKTLNRALTGLLDGKVPMFNLKELTNCPFG